MYKLKFKKMPKAIKKHLKSTKTREKYYALNEANLLFSNAIVTTKATGEVVVTIICPTGEPEYEFQVVSDPNQSLSEQVLKDFDKFLNDKQDEIEVLYQDSEKNKDKIKTLEDDILILTNRAKEIREAFDGFKDEGEQDEIEERLEEMEIMDAITEAYDDPFEDTDLFGNVEETELVDDVFADIEDESNDPLEPKHESPVASATKAITSRVIKAGVKSDENKVLAYLDVSTFDGIQTLENQINEINGQIKKGVERYIFDELYLTSATDFASKEKKELIRAKYLSQADQALKSMRDWSKQSLDELKHFASNKLNAKHDELNAHKASVREQRVMSMAEMLKVTIDKRKGELRKEIIAKCDVEIAEMEATLDAEKDQKLTIEVEKIDQTLAKGFNENHEKAMVEHRAEIAQFTTEKASEVSETINKGYSGLLAEIKTNLRAHEKAIETRYQLYKEDKENQFTKDISNRELELRARQIEIEERKLNHTNETRVLSEQVEQLKTTLEKNRLEDQMQLLARDKADQAKEMTKLKRLVGVSVVLMVAAIAGIAFFLI